MQVDPVDSAAELAVLLAPGHAELAVAFGASELAPRVAALCMLHCWVQQAQGTAAAEDSEALADCAAVGSEAREAGLLMWRQLLALATTDPELSAARYSPLGLLHRKKASDG